MAVAGAEEEKGRRGERVDGTSMERRRKGYSKAIKKMSIIDKVSQVSQNSRDRTKSQIKPIKDM
jgi:hypothetical protein